MSYLREFGRGEGGENKKKAVNFAWLFLSLENFREVLIGWDDAVILWVYQF